MGRALGVDLADVAILTPKNSGALKLNERILDKLPGESVVFRSEDDPIFSPGQLHVALSRARSRAGIYICAPDNRMQNIVYDEVGPVELSFSSNSHFCWFSHQRHHVELYPS